VRALTEAGISPSAIAGTSIGSMVGAFCAAGKLDALEEFARGVTVFGLLPFADPSLSASGMLSGEKIVDELRGHLGDVAIEDLAIPYAAVATDLVTGEEVVMDSGRAVDAVRASICVPGVLSAVRSDDALLVDGGLVNPVPVSVARTLGIEPVIAVDLFGDYREPAPSESRARRLLEKLIGDGPGPLDTVIMAIEILTRELTRYHFNEYAPDAVVTPSIGEFSVADFHRADELIERGRHAGEKALPAIEEALRERDQEP
jgi:NTE family protein